MTDKERYWSTCDVEVVVKERDALRAEVERLRRFVALVQSDVERERGWQDWERGGKGGQHAGSRPWNPWSFQVLLNFEKYLRHLKEADDA